MIDHTNYDYSCWVTEGWEVTWQSGNTYQVSRATPTMIEPGVWLRNILDYVFRTLYQLANNQAAYTDFELILFGMHF